jgi:hypothetical protein
MQQQEQEVPREGRQNDDEKHPEEKKRIPAGGSEENTPGHLPEGNGGTNEPAAFPPHN